MRYLLIVGCLMIAGCDTMAGMGRDMQRAGTSLESRATQSQRPLEVMAYPDDIPDDASPY